MEPYIAMRRIINIFTRNYGPSVTSKYYVFWSGIYICGGRWFMYIM